MKQSDERLQNHLALRFGIPLWLLRRILPSSEWTRWMAYDHLYPVSAGGISAWEAGKIGQRVEDLAEQMEAPRLTPQQVAEKVKACLKRK